MAQKSCIFCGGRPLSKEHVFPQWLSKVLVGLPHGIRSMDQVNVRGIGGESTEWVTGKGLDIVTKDVCRPCNGGWMSQLETVAIPILRPMIAGETIGLDRKAQLTIASWVSLRALMIRTGRGGKRPELLNKWAAEFYKARKPPKHWNIWIASYRGSVASFFETGDFIGAFGEVQGFTVNLIAGEFTFKVIAGERRKIEYSRGTGVSRIVPFEAPNVVWPPKFGANDNVIAKFFQSGLPSETKSQIALDDLKRPRGKTIPRVNLDLRQSDFLPIDSSS